MSRLARIFAALLTVMAGFVVAQCKPVSAHTILLRPERKIGAGWTTDAHDWMSFVAFSPDGKRVASDGPASPTGPFKGLTIWDFRTGRLLRRLAGANGLSPRWTYYVTSDAIRRMSTDRPIVSLAHGHLGELAFSPDERYVAFSPNERFATIGERSTEAGSGVVLYDLRSGREVRSFGSHPAFALAISPNGSTLAAGHWDSVTLWNLRTGRRLGTLRGMGRYVIGLAFSPDGRRLAADADWGRLRIWDVRHRRLVRAFEVGGSELSTPAFSPSGRLVAVGAYGTGTAFVYDLDRGRLVARAKPSDQGCGSVAFSPDGRYLITPSTGGLITWPYDRGGKIVVYRIARHRKPTSENGFLSERALAAPSTPRLAV